MIIGVPKEIKNNENRVGLTPANVFELTKAKHQVLVEKNAGQGIGKANQAYIDAGAIITETASEIFQKADMIIKVKEPQKIEYEQLQPNQILFTYLHLSPDPTQTQGLLKSGCIAIAYETVTAKNATLPLLAPMSEVAGRMSIQVGAYYLQKTNGGMGKLLGGVPGVAPAKVTILGGGVAGFNALKIAVGMGADVTVLDRNIDRLRYINDLYSANVKTLFSNVEALESTVIDSDLVIGTVLIPGANAPKLITQAILDKMKKGSVIVDVAIDQGGCTAVSRPTTHENPIFVTDNGIIIYCVANMPGGVPQTSTYALNNATLPFVLEIANKGVKQALLDNLHLRNGLNIAQGKVTYEAVALAQNLPYVKTEEIIKLL